MAQFYDWLGPEKSARIRLIVMDMWKPFRNVARERAPQAAILFDKFHIIRHFGEAAEMIEPHWDGIAAPTGEQGLVGIRRGSEQQDQGVPAAGLWAEG